MRFAVRNFLPHITLITGLLFMTGTAQAVPKGVVETVGTQGCCFVYEWRFSGNIASGSEPQYYIKLRTGSTSATGDVYLDFGYANAGQALNIPRNMWYRATHATSPNNFGATFHTFHIGSGQCGGGQAQQ